jgi:hypothetical protein
VAEGAEPVSYQGVPLDVPVQSSTGEQFGTLDKVFASPSCLLRSTPPHVGSFA